MANTNELTDAYLMGDLEGTQRADFENKMASDPSFRQEVDTQEGTINSIKEHRRLELKSRLNNIDVATNTGLHVSFGLKMAASVALLATLGFGTYQLVDTNINIAANTSTEENITTQPSISSNNIDYNNFNVNISEEANANLETDVIKNTIPTTISETPIQQINTPIVSTPTTKGIVETEPEAPTLMEGNSNNDFKELTGLDGTIEETTSKSINTDFAKTEIEIRNKKSNDLQYTMAEGKLTLFGDFSEDAIPCILQYNYQNVIRMYLNYAGDFFNISESTRKTRLIKITDNTLKQKLRKVDCQSAR